MKNIKNWAMAHKPATAGIIIAIIAVLIGGGFAISNTMAVPGEPASKHDVEVVADGTASKSPDTDADKSGAIEIPMENVPADKVTDEQIKDINDAVKDAIKKGDETLSGDKGKDAIDKIAENVKKNDGVSEDVKKETEATAEESKANASDEPASTVPTQGNGNSGNSGNGNSGNTASAHQHTWVNETKQEWVPDVKTYTKTVVDQPETTKSVPYDVYRFNYDGFTTEDPDEAIAYQEALMDRWYDGDMVDESFTITTFYRTETVPAVTHEETYQVDEGSYQTVSTGRRVCSSCGAVE